MAELATVARPYAEALFQVARQHDAAAWAEQVTGLARVCAVPEVMQFADNPKTEPAQVLDLLLRAHGGPVADGVRNFLEALIDNGRLSAIGAVSDQLHALINAAGGVADATIHSAYPIADAQLAEVVGVLEHRFARKLAATVHVDPTLIGGIRVVVGDEVLDTSVRARLERMRAALSA